jgi:hypothetical protein
MKQAPSLKAAIECIESSVALIAAGQNEQIIRDSFTSYLRSIFPSMPSWVERHIKSSETALTISKGTKSSTGFVDNLVDLTAIEYESDLTSKAKFEEGQGQIKDYCGSLINAGHKADLVLGVLSDTVRWFVYTIHIKTASPSHALTRDDLELVEVDRMDLSNADEQAARRLLTFLTKYLGRLGARPLKADSIASDLGFSSPFCAGHVAELEKLVDQAFVDKPEYAELITSLWCKFVTYFRDQGSTASFHTKSYADELYILTLGKLICANVIEKRALISDDGDLQIILSGRYFVAKGLVNLVEYDYFGWLNESPYIERQLFTARAIQHDLQAYDFDQSPADDLFGTMMAEFAERSKRLLLGQELTPEWLASQTVEKVLGMLPNGELPQLVDMCCGSGAMIVETVKRAKVLIGNDASHTKREEKVRLLAQSITGFDIDPLAVILSKINWVLAARDWLEPFGTINVTIPVYHADSLFAITPLTDGIENDTGDEFHILKVAEHSIKLPKFLLTPEFQPLFDGVLERTYSMVMAAGLSNKLVLSDKVVSDAIDSVLQATSTKLTEEQTKAVRSFVRMFTEIVDQLNRDGRNGIWAFILRNSYRPGLVVGQFNGLVSNPPWLALSKIADNPYQALLKRKAEAFGIKPAGSSHLHIELATIFLLHSVDQYLRAHAVIGCIGPETILNGHHHNPFRLGAYQKAAAIDFAVEAIWRVQEGTFKNNAIVLFGRKTTFSANEPDPIPGALATENGLSPVTFYRHRQGKRTAWGEQHPVSSSKATGFFCPANFRQGADIMPRTLFLFEATKISQSGQPVRWSIKSIDRTTSSLAFAVKDAKKNESFKITPCVVPGDILFDVLTSNLLTPFHLATPLKALLPIQKSAGNPWVFLDSVVVAAKGVAVQNVFKEICHAMGPRATVATVGSLINVRNKLTQQLIEPNQYLVVTGAGGGHVCSAFAATNSFDLQTLIIDQTLYWTQVNTEDEALYLAGLFNSEAINLVIKDFQPRGAFGERHVHKLPFGVTPPFDASQAVHQAVVETTRHLVAECATLITTNQSLQPLLDPNTGPLARRRLTIQDKIKHLKSYADYDEACRSLYGVS